MKLTLWLIVLLGALPLALAEQVGIYQQGTVVRMRMGDCLSFHHGFMTALGGRPPQLLPEACPEYTLVSEKVVYVIVGKTSNQLIPLADVIDFRLHGSELAVRVDDGKHEIKFSIREMILRAEWDMVQRHIAEQLTAPPPPPPGDIDFPPPPRNDHLR
jgi:hypothetical protein